MCPLPKMFQPQRLALFYHEDFALPSLSTRIRISEANSNGRIIEGVFKSFTGLSLMNVIKGFRLTVTHLSRSPRISSSTILRNRPTTSLNTSPHSTAAYVAAYLDRSLIFRLFLFRRRTRFLCHLARIFGSSFFRLKVLRV